MHNYASARVALMGGAISQESRRKFHYTTPQAILSIDKLHKLLNPKLPKSCTFLPY